jgi:catechol 2,3-dioxygenase-like lactoylglutathione lyase family enzyme
MADPNVTHLAHFTITVRDIRVAEAFYAQIMGADVVRRSWDPDVPDPATTPENPARRRFSQFHLGSVVFDAFQEPEGPWPELRNLTQHPHFAFEVHSLQEACARLDKASVPYQWATFTGPGVEIYFSDPDGNHLEYIISQGYPKDGVKNGEPDWTQLQYDFDADSLRATPVPIAVS